MGNIGKEQKNVLKIGGMWFMLGVGGNNNRIWGREACYNISCYVLVITGENGL